MRTTLLLLLTCFLLLSCFALGGCTGKQDVKDVTASPLMLLEADKKCEEEEELEGVCRHTWKATGFHPYTNTSTGLPFTDLCTIQTCTKCGAERHECARQARQARARRR